MGRDTLGYCALENWFLDVHALPRPLDPIALQLQWRVSRHKEFPGSAALEALRSAGVPRRLTAITGPALTVGDPVELGGTEVGEVVLAGASPRGDHIGAALVDTALAHSGVEAFTHRSHPIRTISPPFVTNRSLFVRWQQHTWAGRDDIVFPDGV